MKKDESPAAAPRAQQNAPAEKIAPPMQPGQDKAGMKPSETTGQAPKASDADRPRASGKGDMDKGATGKSMEKEPAAKGSSGRSGGADMKGKANESTTQAPAPAAPRSSQSTTTEKDATTGQGAASGAVKLSTEQRSKITTIIKQQKVAPAQLNVSVRVGTRVPDRVRFYPLPVEVINIYPEWSGYSYILVGDEILVIDPRTHEIVAILEA
ncbi:MAG: DUF1236 domain-containing protein [Betaproteobacteria bacterium]|nr:DUF1236 domain-containing protein [Betaproteobacteria bacterium]